MAAKAMTQGLGKRFVAKALTVVIAAAVFCVCALAGPKKKLPTRPIDLNRATLAQLEQLPSVGPAMAHAILRFRRQSGPFERVEDLLALRGISRGRLEKIRPYVYVGKPKKRPPASAPRDGKHQIRGGPRG